MSRAPRHWPHLLQVDDDPAAFEPLFAAARDEDLRIGWLRWAPSVEAPVEVDTARPALASAAACGALRAVSVEADGTIALKPRRGAAVLRDILREHFRGCALVLVQVGNADSVDESMARLHAREDGFVVESEARARTLDAESLTARLRRPQPWS